MTAPHVSARPALRVRTSLWLGFALAFVMALTGLAKPALAVAADTPPEQSYVLSITDRAIKILTDKSLDTKARNKVFEDLILANIALDRIAPFALGRYDTAMRASGRYDEYKSLFGQYIAQVYAARLSGYSGEHLQIGRSIPHGTKDFVVFSVIEPGAAGGDPIPVNWRLEKTDGGFKIVDVQIVGAWMSIEQQSQFASIISNNNRDVVKLIDYLRQQTGESEAPAPATATGGTGATPPTGAIP